MFPTNYFFFVPRIFLDQEEKNELNIHPLEVCLDASRWMCHSSKSLSSPQEAITQNKCQDTDGIDSVRSHGARCNT